MKVDSAKQVEIIVQSVIQQYGLADVRLEEVRQSGAAWLITVVRGNVRSSFPVQAGLAANVRAAIARRLGVAE
jgi:hypothetical protein